MERHNTPSKLRIIDDRSNSPGLVHGDEAEEERERQNERRQPPFLLVHQEVEEVAPHEPQNTTELRRLRHVAELSQVPDAIARSPSRSMRPSQRSCTSHGRRRPRALVPLPCGPELLRIQRIKRKWTTAL